MRETDSAGSAQHRSNRHRSNEQRLPAVRTVSALIAVLVSLSAATTACGNETNASKSIPTVTADPTDQPDRDAFDFSDTIEIRDGAVSPAQTVAIIKTDIIFKNVTTTPQTVRVTNGTLGDRGPSETGEIPPGGEYRFRQSTPISITYEVTSQPGLKGRIQVDPGTDTI